MADINRFSNVLTSNNQSFVSDKVDELFEELRKEPVTESASDPFLYFGIGVRNLVRINNRLTCLFLVLAILAFVQMMIFRTFGGLDNFDDTSSVTKWTLGFIGQPKNLCAKNFIDWSKDTVNLNFKCEGNTEISDVLSSGVISFDDAEDYAGLVEVFG